MTQSFEGRLHRYYRAVLQVYAASGRPFFHQMSAIEGRALLRQAAAPAADLPLLEAVMELAIDGPAGAIPLRRYVPIGGGDGICVFMHAGGWVIGDLDLSDGLCRRLAAAGGCELVSVDYRLAPEHPFPAPLDDVWAVLQWAAGQKPRPVVLAGESAGANLAAACAIRARDAGGPVVAGQLLAYPVTDHDFATPSYEAFGELNWLLSRADMGWFWDQYCPDERRRADPLVSPLRVPDAAGLPPAFVLTAEFDPLRDEGEDYALRLACAGVPSRVRRDGGMLHGYLGAAASVPEAAAAVEEAARWIKARVAEARAPFSG